jgi:hypothetical protein
MAFNLAQLQALSRQAGWPESLVEKASAIWMYESGGNPNAHNPRGEDSWGLCQVNWPYHREFNRARLVEPLYNLQACYKIYKGEGWNAWFNSNKKYNSNYQGIAAQARAIYSGQPATVVNASQVQAIFQNPVSFATPEEPFQTDTALKIAAGLFAIVLLTRW